MAVKTFCGVLLVMRFLIQHLGISLLEENWMQTSCLLSLARAGKSKKRGKHAFRERLIWAFSLLIVNTLHRTKSPTLTTASGVKIRFHESSEMCIRPCRSRIYKSASLGFSIYPSRKLITRSPQWDFSNILFPASLASYHNSKRKSKL